ncbi:MAG: phosphomannose isomerase type II C-terminal cupin domain [SAR324 cluster bacterium]|nr:phosphomannose isomerase type II C-terminal cupin domain [SAR324 cluster bacterium]
MIENRPWGNFIVLSDSTNYKVKKITVLPGKRLSLQRHQKRREHWFIVQGVACVTLDEKQIPLSAGEAINIPLRAIHRVENTDKKELLVFIEIQTGESFAETDIERIEDDFGRVNQ